MNRRGELMSTSEFETLGLNGNKLPPLLNLDNPPPHLRLDRFESFKSYFESLGGTSEGLNELLGNIRFIDENDFNLALDTLAVSLGQLEGEVLLVHDGEASKSRKWVADQIALRNERFKSINIDDLPENELPSSTHLVLADDLRIFGEQPNQLVEELTSKGYDELSIIEAYVGSTNIGNGNYRHRLMRVFEVPMLGELSILGLPRKRYVDNHILTFMHHKAADRFYPLLRRYEAIGVSPAAGWLIDDMLVAPPYDRARFLQNAYSSRIEATQ